MRLSGGTDEDQWRTASTQGSVPVTVPSLTRPCDHTSCPRRAGGGVRLCDLSLFHGREPRLVSVKPVRGAAPARTTRAIVPRSATGDQDFLFHKPEDSSMSGILTRTSAWALRGGLTPGTSDGGPRDARRPANPWPQGAVHESAAMRAAQANPSSRSSVPRTANRARRAPWRTSPAPRVSTTSTSGAGTSERPAPVSTAIGSGPRDRATTGETARTRAITSSPGRPVLAPRSAGTWSRTAEIRAMSTRARSR